VNPPEGGGRGGFGRAAGVDGVPHPAVDLHDLKLGAVFAIVTEFLLFG